MKNKALKIIRNIVIGIFGFLFVFIIGMRIFFRVPVYNYYKISKKAFVIPGCNSGFIAQGISYDSADDIFYVTGYMKDSSASPIYLVNKTSKKLIKTVFLQKNDGSVYNDHCGGLTVYDDTLYIAGSSKCKLFGIDRQTIKNATDGSFLTFSKEISMICSDNKIGAAFATTNNGLLYSGEFYREGPYPTAASHTVKTCDGENHALMAGFKPVNGNMEPAVIYSIPANVQGVCFNDGKIYVSTSWGPAKSHIFIYDESKIKQSGTYSFGEKELPLYVLDSSSLIKNWKTAPMAEEIECVDGSFYIMSESASNKYIFGKFTGGFWCYKSNF